MGSSNGDMTCLNAPDASRGIGTSDTPPRNTWRTSAPSARPLSRPGTRLLPRPTHPVLRRPARRLTNSLSDNSATTNAFSLMPSAETLLGTNAATSPTRELRRPASISRTSSLEEVSSAAQLSHHHHPSMKIPERNRTTAPLPRPKPNANFSEDFSEHALSTRLAPGERNASSPRMMAARSDTRRDPRLDSSTRKNAKLPVMVLRADS